MVHPEDFDDNMFRNGATCLFGVTLDVIRFRFIKTTTEQFSSLPLLHCELCDAKVN